LIFPFFFVFVFSSIFQQGNIENPIAYMLAGIVISTVFEFSFRLSSSTIDDMTSGFMKEVLVSPIPRLKIAIGQFISSATVSAMQGVIIFAFGFFLGIRVTTPMTIVYTILVMIFVGLIFSGFGLFIATKAKNIQTFQSITMAITMPLMFTSGAYLPIQFLPDILKYIAYINPLTHAVNLFRAASLEKLGLSSAELVYEGLAIPIGDIIIGPVTSFLILLVFGAVFLLLSTISFINVDFSKMNRNKNDSMEF
jgi:ABC-2 type transport system permease protein